MAVLYAKSLYVNYIMLECSLLIPKNKIGPKWFIVVLLQGDSIGITQRDEHILFPDGLLKF